MFKEKNIKIKKVNKRSQLIIIALLFAITSAYFIYTDTETKEAEINKIEEISEDFYNKDKEEAIEELESYVDKCDNCIEAEKKLLSFYFQERKYEEFKKRFSEDIKTASLCNMRAYIAMKDSNYQVAENYYNDAIRLAPRSSNYYVNFATFYIGTGSNDKAREVVDLGKQRGIESPELLVLSSSIALRVGDYEVAKSDSLKVLEKDPENKQALAIKDKLDSL